MPIEYAGKKYRFDSLVNKIKRTKPEISNPNGYVGAIEKRQHKARMLKAKLQKLSQDLTKPRRYKKTYVKPSGEFIEDENERRKAIQDKLNKGAGIGHDNATRGTTDEEQGALEKAKRDKIFQQSKVNMRKPGASL